MTVLLITLESISYLRHDTNRKILELSSDSKIYYNAFNILVESTLSSTKVWWRYH